MTIIINNPTVRPALVFDRIHVNHFTYSSEPVQDAPRSTDATVTPYALDANGDFVFDPVNTFKASTEDFDSLAVPAWLAVNPGRTPDDAIAAYAAARGAVQTQYAAGSLDIFTLMAYFELAIGVAVQMTGPVALSKVV